MGVPQTNRRYPAWLIICFVTLAGSAASAPRVLALGEESFGNDPVSPNAAWPAGLPPLVNDAHRVYRSWVNGNEDFYFSGDLQALHGALETFAKVSLDTREVFFLPVPGETKSFEGKPVSFTWHLKAPEGLYLAMARREKDTNVHFRKATLFVHVAGAIRIEDIKLPGGLAVLDAGDLIERTKRGLKSAANDIRGQALLLAADHPYAEGAVDLLVEGLKDPDDWVKTCAASGLRHAGAWAKDALPALREQAKKGSEKLKKGCEEAASAIEKAASATASAIEGADSSKDAAGRETEVRKALRAIHDWKAALRKAAGSGKDASKGG